MKRKNVLIDKFFRGVFENDEFFFEALRNLHRAERSMTPRRAITVKEQSTPYGRRPVSPRGGMDQALCSVGEALHETLVANGWTEKEAAEKLGVSETMIRSLLGEMMPLTGKTARFVAAFLCEIYQATPAQLLADYLLNGLHFWELKHFPKKEAGLGNKRKAARRKRNDKEER